MAEGSTGLTYDNVYPVAVDASGYSSIVRHNQRAWRGDVALTAARDILRVDLARSVTACAAPSCGAS